MNKTSKKQFPIVFLCYCRQDGKGVRDLYARLKKDSIRVWLDSEDLLPGQNWQYEIRNAILKSKAVIVCLSRKFDKQQGYRHEEVKIALDKARLINENGVFVIPARLEKCIMPKNLTHLHCVDLFETTGYKKLVRALQRLENSDK